MILEKLKNKKIGVLYGGTSSEREISLKSGKAVLAALKRLKLNAVGIDAGKDAAEKIKKAKIDLAVIMLHGKMGEDGTIQGLLEIMRVPYTGCGVFASSASMDKIITKRILESCKILTPGWTNIKKYESFKEPKKYPVIVKPARQGSAIGVSLVKSKKEFFNAAKNAFKYDDEILVEQFIKGTEITVGVLGGKALPVVEIVPKGKFYDFKSKYAKGGSKHIIPARISKKAYALAQKTAAQVFKALNCRAVSRIDMIVDKNGKAWVLENNTLPGMTETSLLPDEAKACGMSFDDLVLKIIECSL